MRKSTFIIVLLCLMVNAAQAQTRVQLFNGRVSFTPPRGFKAMSAKRIALKFPRAHAPKYVWANSERATVSVAVNTSPTRMLPSQLRQFRSYMEKLLPAMSPGLKWLKREEITLGGRRWVHFEFISRAVDTQVYNDMYFTSFDNKMLAFNFNATAAEQKKARPLFLRCRNSIRLKS